MTLIACGGHNNDVTPDADTCDLTAPEVCGDGKDNNCDGNIDEGCNGLGTYVSAATGDDANPGTQLLPVATIARGLANAATIGGAQKVYVAEGHYSEKVTMVEGNDLIGGYSCTVQPCTWDRDPATYDAAILDTDFEGVLVPATLTRATTIDGFRIVGMDGAPSAAPGGVALAMYGAATVSNNRIFGGTITTANGVGSGSFGIVVYPPSPATNTLVTANDITLGTSVIYAAGISVGARGQAAGPASAELRANVIHGGSARTTAGIAGNSLGATLIMGNTITSGSSKVAGGGAWGIQGFGTMTIDSNRINTPPNVPGGCTPADVCGGIESQSSTSTITNNIIYGAPTARSAAVRLREVEVAAGAVILNSNFLDGGGLQGPGGNQTVSAAVAIEYTGCGQCGVNAVMGRIRNNIMMGGSANLRFGILEANTQQKTNRPEAVENNLFWFALSSGLTVDVLWHQWNGTVATDLTLITQVNMATMPVAVMNQKADPTVDASWHLVAGSPCINTGTVTEDPTTDMDGNARPNGAPDIGPDEM